MLQRTICFSKKYKDQNDRNAKIYGFKNFPDQFPLKSLVIPRDRETNLFFIIHPYFWVYNVLRLNMHNPQPSEAPGVGPFLWKGADF